MDNVWTSVSVIENLDIFPSWFQILASSAKNMLLFTYGTTLGLPTIAIPVLSASDGDDRDPYLSLTRSQISWFSK